ncbi:cobalt-precorrin-6A reductase [Kribbella sancticallisti]|uniref:Cobalt-precorrin-6A reductase n=1 Tax=Kribbella sancticallisti TaxID=460087 RepID=A0ABP4PU33_9ACTN
MKVLLLGGTGEARRLAELLADDFEVVSSLAGRTVDAQLPAGAVRQGGFGGVEGLTDWLTANAVDAVVDATHPFAATMTAHAAAATSALGMPLLVVRRPGWHEQPGDRWVRVGSAEEAAGALPSLGSRAFLTIGRQGLDAFAAAGVWMLARCVDPPSPVPSWCELLLDRGPYELAGEVELLRKWQIDVLVTKNSGGDMTSAKLTAARELGLPVVVIDRPPLPAGVDVVDGVDQVAQWLREHR